MIAVLSYGNAGAIVRALQSQGVQAERVTAAAKVSAAQGLVLPGVGHASATMEWLREHGVDQAVRDFVAAGKPVVGVCVGGQVLCERSEEGDTKCLGILGGSVVKQRAMFVGWREVEGVGPRYFCHQYTMPADVMRSGAVVAYQYHPEKSGRAGLRELARAFGVAN